MEALLREKSTIWNAQIPQSVSQPSDQPSSWVGPSNAKSLLTTRSNCTSLALTSRRGRDWDCKEQLNRVALGQALVGRLYMDELEQPAGPCTVVTPAHPSLPRALKKLPSRELAQSSRQ